MGIELDSATRLTVQKYGLSWPEVDEDVYALLAADLESFAALIDDDTAAAGKAMDRLIPSGKGEAITALAEHWDRVKRDDMVPLGTSARALALRVRELPGTIAALKLSVANTAVALAANEASADASVALSPAGPAAVALANAETARKANADYRSDVQSLRRALRTVLTDPAVIALEKIPDDLAGTSGGGGSGGSRWKDAFDRAGGGAEKGIADGIATGAAASGAHGRAIGSALKVDHEEHQVAARRIAEVGGEVLGDTRTKLNEAVGEHGTAKSSGSLGTELAESVDLVLDRLTAATTAVGNHLSTALPDAILLASSSQQDTDDGNRRRMAQLD
ncbi:hypothetical protein PV371_11150 [Streptomyces sp. TX20-6-3]|uniref:hypothetical protein n=1 Tax=Streptomyces sp. TX20-6-3 TaxID=3028705 RepID=UPI0029AA3BEE|nr:hypothetical protein [Streptomyces sp. TX20-6-3]MDX2560202.1 hypothetical protein [Streptomyces sp. TX20-6-3]